MTETSSTTATLLADIGGTNARFALLTDSKLSPITHMAVGDYGTFPQALTAYLGDTRRSNSSCHLRHVRSG